MISPTKILSVKVFRFLSFLPFTMFQMMQERARTWSFPGSHLDADSAKSRQKNHSFHNPSLVSRAPQHSEMQGHKVNCCKSQNVTWADIWESCLQWLTLFLQLLLRIVESIPALRQLLELSGLRPFYLPVSHVLQSSPRSMLLPSRDKKDEKKLTVSSGNIQLEVE